MSRIDSLRMTGQKLLGRGRRDLKHLRQRVGSVDRAEHGPLLILGCQRSGTTMLSDVFERDAAARVHGELGSLFSSEADNHRLLPVPDVRRRIDASAAGLVVLKPLVESQRTQELLDGLGDSRAVWLYRNYADVASSNLRRFGADNGHRNLERLRHGEDGDWRADRVPSDVRSAVESLASDLEGAHDAAALFWWCRNALWFSQDLSADPRVLLCRYEDLVGDPTATVGRIYDHVGLRAPAERLGAGIHRDSVGLGEDADISGPVRDLCDEMQHALDADNTASRRPT